MTPKTSSRWMSGAASTEWIADSRTKASRSGVCSKRTSSRYSPVRARGPGPDRQARDADVGVDLDAVEELEVGLGPRLHRGVEPGFGHALPVDQVDGHAAGLEEARRRVDDRLEDLALVAHRADAAGDLAERPLGVGGLGELGTRPAELVDEPRVRDGDRRLARQRADEASVGRRERAEPLRVDLDDPERACLAGDRRGDHRLEAGALVELRGLGRRRELVLQVAEGQDHPVLGHGRPGRPDPDVDPQLGPLLVGEEVADPAVERPVEVARRRVEEVEDHAVGADQADGLLDDVAEDLARVAQHGDARGDLAQGLLRLGAAAERLARLAELRDEPRRGDRDRRLVGDGDEELRVRLAPRVLRVGRRRSGPRTGPPRRSSGAAITECRSVRRMNESPVSPCENERSVR